MSSLPFWPIAVVDLLVIAMLIVSLPVIFLCTHVQCFVIGMLLRRASLDFDGLDGAVLFLFFSAVGFQLCRDLLGLFCFAVDLICAIRHGQRELEVGDMFAGAHAGLVWKGFSLFSSYSLHWANKSFRCHRRKLRNQVQPLDFSEILINEFLQQQHQTLLMLLVAPSRTTMASTTTITLAISLNQTR